MDSEHTTKPILKHDEYFFSKTLTIALPKVLPKETVENLLLGTKKESSI